jgi:tRNA threonylcarbamoyladenosine modification (KEOPS) complex Cgi121 subunit
MTGQAINCKIIVAPTFKVIFEKLKSLKSVRTVGNTAKV